MSHLPDAESASKTLIVEGARQNNLKNISLRIPHNQVTAITGLSGSGKSSLAFDTFLPKANGAMWNRSPPMPACFSTRSLGPMSIAFSTSARPLPSNKRTTCGPPARRSAPRQKLPTCFACSLPKSANRSVLTVIKRLVISTRHRRERSARTICGREGHDALPGDAAFRKAESAFLQSLLTRGFTRLRWAMKPSISIEDAHRPSMQGRRLCPSSSTAW